MSDAMNKTTYRLYISSRSDAYIQRVYRTIKTATLKRTFKCRVADSFQHFSDLHKLIIVYMKHANKPNEGTPLFCYFFVFFNNAIWFESKIV